MRSIDLTLTKNDNPDVVTYDDLVRTMDNYEVKADSIIETP